jgi:hypothetical protein
LACQKFRSAGVLWGGERKEPRPPRLPRGWRHHDVFLERAAQSFRQGFAGVDG